MESSEGINRKRKLVQGRISIALPKKIVKLTDSTYEEEWNQPTAKRPIYSNEVQSSSSIQNEDYFYKIKWKKLVGEASIWPFLTIQGPNQHIFPYLTNDVLKKHAFCKLLREIAMKIHELALKFRNEIICSEMITMLTKKVNSIESENLIEIVEKMCQKLFNFGMKGGTKVDFYDTGTMSCIQKLFAKKTLRIEFDAVQEIVERLKHICYGRNVYVTPKQLNQVGNVFVRYIFDLSLDLIMWITKRNANRDPDRILIEKIIHHPFICNNEEAHSQFKWLRMSARLEEVSTSLMERNKHKSSLWKSILSADSIYMLEYLSGYDLNQLLPQKAVDFFRLWLTTVKSRVMLFQVSLREYIKTIVPFEKMSIGDARVQKFLAEIGTKMFNSKKLEIFNKSWQDYTLNLIGKMRGGAFKDDLDCEKLVERIRRMTNPSVLEFITSFFPDTNNGRSLVSHVLVHLLRFVLCFLLNTIRHLFHFDPNTFTVYYDGRFEGDEEKDARIHQKYDQESYNGHFDVKEHKSMSESGNQGNAQKNEPVSEKIHQSFEICSNRQPKKEISSEMLIKAELPDLPNPLPDPVQIRHQATSLSKRTYLNPCCSTRKVPIVEEKSSTEIVEDVPKKWQKGYKLLVEWNKELETEFRRIQETLNQFK